MSTELITLAPENYPALAQGNGPCLTNLGNEGISAFDLPTIRRVGPTTLKWETGDPANPQTIDEIRGVILWTNFRRRRYVGEFGENPLPACYSFDGKAGVGDPGGVCEKCPCDGADCHPHRPMLILREGQNMPEVVNISMTSLPNIRRWLFSVSKPYWQVLARLRMVSSQTRGKPPRAIARIVIETVGDLDADTIRRVAEKVKQYEAVFASTRFAEFDGGEESNVGGEI